MAETGGQAPRRPNGGGQNPPKLRPVVTKYCENTDDPTAPPQTTTPVNPKRATKTKRSKRSHQNHDDDEGVATPILKSSTINNIIAAMAQSSSATLGDSLPSVPPNPPTPTPEEVGGREIGPWSLGEVLSEGQTGTVRLGAHRVTGEVVAVKVVAKNRAHISQTASLANLELREAERPSTVPRIPLGIEREVAILKLIRHPNVIHLIDIWENKANLYIVTEFLEKGDMYQFVNWNGPVREHEAISYFRQIMDGMQFVHSLNLCHRDLKLDNILLGPKGQVKIADFGMAAVHQHPRHRLETPCGSIHHAAPEVLNKELYDGCLADIWSMGIILFSMLGSRLPFDEEDLTLMSEKVKKAEYDVPFWFSDEAVDFFSIVLVVDPTQRLSIAEMWGHPLITNYNHVDDLSEPRESTGGRTNNYPPILEANVDPQLLRQLQALWHDYAEEEILWKLRQTSANDFKLFYWLLYRHRERQLEKYGTGASTSEEENHLLKPVNWTQRYAKCDFRRRAHANRFIVFGNDDGETPSDPFFPTGNPQLSPRKPFRVNPANAEFAIHRYKPVRQNRAASTKADNSSTLSSRNGSIGSRGRPVPNPRSRRGVQFSHSRNRSSTRSIRSGGSGSDTTSLRGSVAGESDTEEESREGLSYIQQKPIAKDISTIFEEDVIKSGEEVSGFCDEAFFQNNSMLEAEAASAKLEPTPFKLSLNPEPDMNKLMDQSWYYGPPSDPTPYMNRPLPPTPKTMSAESAEWLRKQKQIPVPPWMPFGGAHLFPTPANLEFTIAGASPGSRHTIHNPAISDPSLPGLSVSGSSGGSSARPASEVPDAIPDAPPAAVKRRKSYMLFPTAHIRNKPAPPGLAPSVLPPVSKPPNRRTSWFRPSAKNVPDEVPKIPQPSLYLPDSLNLPRRPLPQPPTAAAAPIPSIRVVVESPPPPTVRAQNDDPFGPEPRPSNIPAPLIIRKISQSFKDILPPKAPAQDDPFYLKPRPSNIPAPLNVRKTSRASQISQASQTPQMSQTVEGTEPIPARAPLNIRKISQTSQISQPAQGTAPVAARAPLNIRKISQASQMSQPGEGTAAAARVPINIHRKVTLPNPLPVRERAPLAPRRQVSLVETEVRLKDEARAKELEAARLKRASAVPGVPAWMKRTTRGEALAGDLAEIARVGKAKLVAPAAAANSGSTGGSAPAVGHGMGAADNRHHHATKDKRTPTFNFSWPKWLPQPGSAIAGGNMAMRSDEVVHDDDYVTDDDESGLPDETLAKLRAAAQAERIRKFEQFRRETGLAAAPSPRPIATPQRPTTKKPAAPAPAPLDRAIEAKKPWLARLFGVGGKPTVKYLCFGISRGRTLRKVIGQLEGWKGHGIEELVADPRRGMVWVTVAEKNALKLKPVAFAIEVFRIVEEVDNVMKEIAIARVTLEKGSSRSLKEAVKTMKKAFADRGILVADKSRAKMMTITMEKSGI